MEEIKERKEIQEKEQAEQIFIHTPFIQMQQMLKWIGVAENGAMAKELCREGMVRVNGTVETACGKKLYPGDKLLIDEVLYEISIEP